MKRFDDHFTRDLKAEQKKRQEELDAIDSAFETAYTPDQMIAVMTMRNVAARKLANVEAMLHNKARALPVMGQPDPHTQAIFIQ